MKKKPLVRYALLVSFEPSTSAGRRSCILDKTSELFRLVCVKLAQGLLNVFNDRTSCAFCSYQWQTTFGLFLLSDPILHIQLLTEEKSLATHVKPMEFLVFSYESFDEWCKRESFRGMICKSNMAEAFSDRLRLGDDFLRTSIMRKLCKFKVFNFTLNIN